MCELEIKETISADYASASEQFVRVLESNKALSDRVDTHKERITQLEGQLAGSESSRMQLEQLVTFQTSTIEQFQNLQQQLPAHEAAEASLEVAKLRRELAKVNEELAHAHGVNTVLESQLTSQSVLQEQCARENSVAEQNEYRKVEVARLQDELARLQCTQVELENQLVEMPSLHTTIAELHTNKQELSEQLLVLTRKNQELEKHGQELEKHGLQLAKEMADQQQKQSEIQLSGLKSQNTRLKEQLSKQYKQLSKQATELSSSTSAACLQSEVECLQSDLASSHTQKDAIQLELTQANGQISDARGVNLQLKSEIVRLERLISLQSDAIKQLESLKPTFIQTPAETPAVAECSKEGRLEAALRKAQSTRLIMASASSLAKDLHETSVALTTARAEIKHHKVDAEQLSLRVEEMQSELVQERQSSAAAKLRCKAVLEQAMLQWGSLGNSLQMQLYSIAEDQAAQLRRDQTAQLKESAAERQDAQMIDTRRQQPDDELPPQTPTKLTLQSFKQSVADENEPTGDVSVMEDAGSPPNTHRPVETSKVEELGGASCKSSKLQFIQASKLQFKHANIKRATIQEQACPNQPLLMLYI